VRRLALGLLVAGCTSYGTGGGGPLYVAPVDPAVLAGTWYEVASFPGPFQRGCANATATYDLRPDGRIGVVNRCTRDGRPIEISGTATVVAPGRLKVRLEGVPVAGDYWILGLSRDGQSLFVGTPTRIAGWVLSRDRQFSRAEAEAADRIFGKNGYDTAALRETARD
jgi:apolipoprotein D and lipocalin family protein